MGQMKNFDPALYSCEYDAVVNFIQEGHLSNYDFNVCSADAVVNALAYLCINDIPHHYHLVSALGISVMTISFGNDVEYSYSFWTEYKEGQDEV
jgi:hypothetical protein